MNKKFSNCEIILSDVAGTTTSISFVKDVLFKFADDNVEAFLTSHWNSDDVQHAIKLLDTENLELTVGEAIKVFKDKTKKNDSNKGLKLLQGLLYKQAYETGKLKAHVFPDVARCFKAWSQSHRIAVYSTGSVDSQRLLFLHTIEGDLSQFIEDYFDLSVGLKTESSSYKNIANQLKVTPEKILFLTDSLYEAKAAEEAGCIAVLISRPDSAIQGSYSNIIKSFDELQNENLSNDVLDKA